MSNSDDVYLRAKKLYLTYGDNADIGEDETYDNVIREGSGFKNIHIYEYINVEYLNRTYFDDYYQDAVSSSKVTLTFTEKFFNRMRDELES